MNNHTQGGVLTVADLYARCEKDADRNGWPAVERWEPREGYDGVRFKPSTADRVRVVLKSMPLSEPVNRLQVRPWTTWHRVSAHAWKVAAQAVGSAVVATALVIVVLFVSGGGR